MTHANARAILGALLAATAVAAGTACGASREAVQPAPAPAQEAPAQEAPTREVAGRGTPGQAAPATGAQGHEAAMARARADSMRRPYTEADVRFMQHMIAHHAQAIEMAAMAPTHGASDQVRTLAARIANGQRDEIATMQRWLRDRGREVPEVPEARHGGTHDAHGSDDAPGAHGAHGAHDAPMPGMLTAAEMRALDEARDRAFDRLFLTSMIRHHRGAIVMVDELFGSHGAGQDETVFRLATDVNVDQITEIARMERMLLTLAIEDVGMSR